MSEGKIDPLLQQIHLPLEVDENGFPTTSHIIRGTLIDNEDGYGGCIDVQYASEGHINISIGSLIEEESVTMALDIGDVIALSAFLAQLVPWHIYHTTQRYKDKVMAEIEEGGQDE